MSRALRATWNGRRFAGRFAFPGLVCLAAVAGPATASETALDRVLGGVWGSPRLEQLRCRDNAKRPELVAPDLLRFHYDSGIDFPPGTWTEALDYRILWVGPDRMVMRIPNEYRLDAAGNPVVWELRFETPDRFCWHWIGSDDPDSCFNPQIRCPAPPAIS